MDGRERTFENTYLVPKGHLAGYVIVDAPNNG